MDLNDLIIGLYIAELTLLYKFNYLPQKKNQIFLEDKNRKLEIKYVKKIINLVKNEIYPFNGFDYVFFKDNQEIYPLGNLSDTNIHLCHETGQDVFYKSDRYGFRNTDKVWEKDTLLEILGQDTQAKC